MSNPGDNTLYDQLIGLTNLQVSLHKWKAVALGAVFSASLGFATSPESASILALAGVPFITVYFDLLIRNQDLTIGALSKFLVRQEGLESEFLRHLDDVRAEALHTALFANIAVILSSVIPNVAAILFTRMLFPDPTDVTWITTECLKSVIIYAQAFGIFMGFGVSALSGWGFNKIRKVEPRPNGRIHR